MKKYHIIYCDPPWSYRDKKKSGRTKCGAENHYPTLTLEELKRLPIQNICEDNCVLYMWVTFPMLKEGLELIEAWGFEYKTLGFDWTKLNSDGSIWHGVGAYSKSNNEICLFATKGNVGRLMRDENGKEIVFDPKEKLSVRSNNVSCNVQAVRGKHSEKPEEVRRRIEELWGNVSRVELFARKKVEGWDSIGFDIDGRDIREVLEGYNG